jgi:hypothetical protein
MPRFAGGLSVRFDRTARKIFAYGRDWEFLQQVAKLRSHSTVPVLGLWREKDDEFLWQGIMSQIYNRGGTGWSDALRKKGLRDTFYESVSLSKLRTLSSEHTLNSYIAEQIRTFHVGRFPKDNTRSVATNLATFTDATGHLTQLRKRLDELDCTADPIGPKVQGSERKARTFLMEHLVFYQNGKKYHVKRKPPSDFLINVGFARTLIPFDTRMKKVFERVFRIKVSEEANYEVIEDFFVSEVFPVLNLTPAEFDRIIFQHSKDLLPS